MFIVIASVLFTSRIKAKNQILVETDKHTPFNIDFFSQVWEFNGNSNINYNSPTLTGEIFSPVNSPVNCWCGQFSRLRTLSVTYKKSHKMTRFCDNRGYIQDGSRAGEGLLWLSGVTDMMSPRARGRSSRRTPRVVSSESWKQATDPTDIKHKHQVAWLHAAKEFDFYLWWWWWWWCWWWSLTWKWEMIWKEFQLQHLVVFVRVDPVAISSTLSILFLQPIPSRPHPHPHDLSLAHYQPTDRTGLEGSRRNSNAKKASTDTLIEYQHQNDIMWHK